MRLSWIASATATALALTSIAYAQECTQDSDCEDPLMYCDFGQSGTGVDGEPEDPGTDDTAGDSASEDAPCVGDDCPVVEPLTGVCQVDPHRCATDDDCEEGYLCEVVAESGSSAALSADGEIVEEPVVTQIRECVAQPLTCETDADCPAPLRCASYEEGECTETATASDASEPVTSECTTTTVKACVWDPGECQADTDCSEGYECAAFETETICTVAPCTDDDPDCNPEPVCEPAESIAFCFPQQIACTAAADCADGWECTDLDAFDGEVPPWWDPSLGSQYCLPVGILLAIEGRAEVGGALAGTSDDSGGVAEADAEASANLLGTPQSSGEAEAAKATADTDEENSTGDQSADDDDEAADGEAEETADDEAEGDSGGSEDDGGCTASAQGRPSPGGALALMLSLGTMLLLRRRSARA